MAKFSTATVNRTKTINKANAIAFAESPELELVSLLLTNMVNDQFYRPQEKSLERLRQLIKLNDRTFAAQAGIYARTKFGMRSITHVLLAELARESKGLASAFEKTIYRPDDITETLAYYITNYKMPLPAALKKGLRLAFGKFDAYQLAKYKGEGKIVSLVDAVNLLHPKPSEKNASAIGDLIKGTLKSTETWESKLTKAGQESAGDEEKKEELKAAAWADLLKERKIGYFALLRNLRNIIEQAPDQVQAACDMLVDEALIKKSLIMPFQFYKAIEAVGSTNRKVQLASSKALDLCLSNVPEFPGKMLIAVDVSGSMAGVINIAAIFAAALYKKNDADLVVFNTTAHWPKLQPTDSLATMTAQLASFGGGGTDFNVIFQDKVASKKYDRIVILSDMQGWVNNTDLQTRYHAYCKKFERPFLYSFNVCDQGSLMFPESKVYCVAGLSDKTFDVMKMLEQDRNALVNEIKKVQVK